MISILSYYYSKLGFQLVYIVALGVIAAAFEITGIALLFSYFQYMILLFGGSDSTQTILHNTSNWLTIPDYVMTNLHIYVVVFFSLKSLSNFTAIYYSGHLKKKLIIDTKNQLTWVALNSHLDGVPSLDEGSEINLIIEQANRSVACFESCVHLCMQLTSVAVFSIILCLFAPSLGLIALIYGGGLILIFKYLSQKIRQAAVLITTRSSVVAQKLLELLNARKYLQFTGKQNWLDLGHESDFSYIGQLVKLHTFYTSITASIKEPIILIFIIGTIYFQVTVMEVEVELVFVGMLMLYRLGATAFATQGNYQQVLENAGGIHLISARLNLIENVNREKTVEKNKITFSPKIRLKDISLDYEGRKIFKQLNLEIIENTYTLIVGPSGSGKSSLLRILAGLEKSSSGSIFIGENEASKISLEEWRNHIGYVPQYVPLFNGTIAENISMNFSGSLDDDELEHVRFCISQTELFDFVNTLKMGVNTPIGESGNQLSGGLRQRVGLARELFKKPKVLILDEFTSNLDKVTELNILKSVKEISKHVTIISVSHKEVEKSFCDFVIPIGDK